MPSSAQRSWRSACSAALLIQLGRALQFKPAHRILGGSSNIHQYPSDSPTVVGVDSQIAIARRLAIPATPRVILNGWQFVGPIPESKLPHNFSRDIRDGKHSPPNNQPDPSDVTIEPSTSRRDGSAAK